jgi:phosphoribosylformylglycinamidine cyclo-ligase
MSKPAWTYRDAGVDIAAGDAFARAIRGMALRAQTRDVLPSGDAYAGLYRLPLAGLQTPLLAATCDGVGTKILVARACGSYRALGQDLVAMNVNDLLPRGARPLFFLDYLAVGKIALDAAASDPRAVPMLALAEGIVDACAASGCALLGGETAEMPDLYGPGDCDLAGFAVGIVDQAQVPMGDVGIGDVVLGLPSNGVHANGFSLVRRVVAEAGLDYREAPPELDRPLGAELLRPTSLYVEPVLALLDRVRVKAAAHITGGGLLGRAEKLVQEGQRIVLDPRSYPRPVIFDLIARWGGVTQAELARTFNMGLGFLVVLAADEAERALSEPSSPWLRVGDITAGCGADLGYARS